MKITEHEMRGLLNGKCLPGDMSLNEDLPAYLVRKFDELQQKLDALEDKLRIKQNHIRLRDSYIEELEAREPVVDADYLNSVRAEIVNELCIAFVQHAEMVGLADHEKVTLKECTDAVLHCAEQLRSGTHDTADKAG